MRRARQYVEHVASVDVRSFLVAEFRLRELDVHVGELASIELLQREA